MNKSLQNHLDAIRAGEVTKTNVIGIRKALNNLARAGAGFSISSEAPDADDLDTVISELHRCSPKVAGELHDTGIKVLQSPRYTKRWEPWQREAIAALDHFRLVDFDQIGRWGEYSVPVYEVWAKVPAKGDVLDGGTYQAFRFRNIAWQSGGNGPEIVS